MCELEAACQKDVEQNIGVPDADTFAARLEARIAALHSGLQLTPEQESRWPAFEQAIATWRSCALSLAASHRRPMTQWHEWRAAPTL
jgi:hypothetical protein